MADIDVDIEQLANFIGVFDHFQQEVECMSSKQRVEKVRNTLLSDQELGIKAMWWYAKRSSKNS